MDAPASKRARISVSSFVIVIMTGISTALETANKFKSEIELIQKNIEDDNLEKVSNDIKKWSKSWHKEKEIWYKIVNHEYFDDICLSLNIIEQSIKYDDKLNALEQVETIKMLLNNILESEKCDLNHIF